MKYLLFNLLIIINIISCVQQEANETLDISVELPSYSEEYPESFNLRKRNVYRVQVNEEGQLLVRGEKIHIDSLKEHAKLFIANYGKNPAFSTSPRNAIISLQNSHGNHYDFYIAVYKELKAAYFELWETESLKRFGKSYNDLSKDEVSKIKLEIPLVLSEANPEVFNKK